MTSNLGVVPLFVAELHAENERLKVLAKAVVDSAEQSSIMIDDRPTDEHVTVVDSAAWSELYDYLYPDEDKK